MTTDKSRRRGRVRRLHPECEDKGERTREHLGKFEDDTRGRGTRQSRSGSSVPGKPIDIFNNGLYLILRRNSVV